MSIIELEYQVRPVLANLSVLTFCDFFCWAKNPHTQAGLTFDTCKSIDGTLFLNCIQIKTNSGNAHRNDQYTPVSFVFKISQKSQIVNINKQQKIHYGNADWCDVRCWMLAWSQHLTSLAWRKIMNESLISTIYIVRHIFKN